MSRRARFVKCAIMWAGVVVYFAGSGFLLALDLNKPKSEEELIEVIKVVPEMKIILDGMTLDEINDGSKRVGYVGNEMFLTIDDEEYYFNDVEIRGRGNASWFMDKKSYRIKLPKKINLLGLGRLKKWGLISSGIDNTLMRNDLGHHVAGLLYDNYPIKGDFVTLEIDSSDLGLYYMVVLIDIGKDVVNLRDQAGILVEIDNAYCDDTKGNDITRLMHDCISVEDAVAEDNLDEALGFFMDDYDEFEKFVKRGDYKLAASVADMESYAKYYILSELSSNPDAYITSWYLYRDGKEDKFHSGVGWDFDAAFGNLDWGNGKGKLYSPTELMARMKDSIDGWDDYKNDVKRCDELNKTLMSPMMCYMLDMPEFRDLVSRIYREKLMGRKEEIISYIYEKANYIRDEAIANNTFWDRGDFDDGVEYLVWWVEKRFDYLDGVFGGGWPDSTML